MTANRLFREAFLQAAIEDFAWAKLRELVPPPKRAPAAPDAAPAHALENGSAAPDQARAPANTGRLLAQSSLEGLRN